MLDPRAPRTLCMLTLTAALVAGANAPAYADDAALAKRIETLAAELDALKAELAKIKQERIPTTANTAPLAAMNGESAPAQEPATVLTSYGEITYNRPTKRTEKSEADLRRLVIGYQHRFDPKTKAAVEVEYEHAVTSKGDEGETAVEQAYVEHQFTPSLAARAGLFLIPAGLLNENHEPTAYYGVERNFVETAIIPSTWREGGAQLTFGFDNGLTLQGGVTTSFNLNKWDATSTDGRDSPLGSIHQELSKAKSKDLALFGAANWRGVPGLLIGASIFSGGASQGQPGTPNAHVTLWDVHARWTPGPWDLSSVYARGKISNTAAFNTPLVGSASLVPSVFDGGYLQAAYRARIGEYGLAPFARIERFNTAKRYEDIGAGLTPQAAPTERVITLGLNFDLNRFVVLKTDYQWFKQDSARNRFDLGLGWSF